MSLSFAIDALHAAGWSALDTSGCGFDDSGRAYPSIARVRNEFSRAGFDLDIRRVDQFNCYQATWREAGAADAAGSVVSLTEIEAAVFALAHLRRAALPASQS
jgi:hypothetical protein